MFQSFSPHSCRNLIVPYPLSSFRFLLSHAFPSLISLFFFSSFFSFYIPSLSSPRLSSPISHSSSVPPCASLYISLALLIKRVKKREEALEKAEERKCKSRKGKRECKKLKNGKRKRKGKKERERAKGEGRRAKGWRGGERDGRIEKLLEKKESKSPWL